MQTNNFHIHAIFCFGEQTNSFSTSLSLFLSSHFYGGAFSCIFFALFQPAFFQQQILLIHVTMKTLRVEYITSESLFGKFRWHFKGIIHTVMI
jgi:hypothetical protein